MRKALSVFLFFVCFASNAAASPAPTYSLDDCYKRALEQLESLKINEAGIRKAEARYDELVASLFPLLSLDASQEFRDDVRNNQGGGDNGDSFGSSRRRSRFLGGFTVRQPIFSGFRDFLLADAAEREISAAKLDHSRAKEVLYQDVADLFFQIHYYQDDLKILQKSEDVLNERLKDLRDFVSLGKSKESELLSSQSDLSEAQATKVQSEGLLRASREMLSYLTGISSSELNVAKEKKPFVRETLDSYLTRGTGRVDISASKEREISGEKQVKAIYREKWPTVSLEGTYDPIDAPSGDHSASAMITLSMPLFDAGRIDAKAAQKNADLDAVRLQTQQLVRATERDIRVSWQKLMASESEVAKFRELASAAQKAYDAQRADYKLGVVNNLDVLQSIRNLQDAKRRLTKAEYDVESNRVALLVAAGGIAQ